jgi:hypothetical protein
VQQLVNGDVDPPAREEAQGGEEQPPGSAVEAAVKPVQDVREGDEQGLEEHWTHGEERGMIL